MKPAFPVRHDSKLSDRLKDAQKANTAIVILKGGLGNQLFQYSFGLKLRDEHGVRVIFDATTGFLLDTEYKRSFELESLIEQDRNQLWYKAAVAVSLAHRFLNKIRRFAPLPRILSIQEEEDRYNANIIGEIKRRSLCILDGYWQSHRYLPTDTSSIEAFFINYSPEDRRVIELGRHMQSTSSVAICIRFYEETKSPLAHSRANMGFSIDSLLKVVREIKSLELNPVLYVFTIRAPEWLLKLRDLEGVIIMDHEGIASQPRDRLWLISRCKYKVISNSTFYWWGSWINEPSSPVDSTVYITGAFINQDLVVPGWLEF